MSEGPFNTKRNSSYDIQYDTCSFFALILSVECTVMLTSLTFKKIQFSFAQRKYMHNVSSIIVSIMNKSRQ